MESSPRRLSHASEMLLKTEKVTGDHIFAGFIGNMLSIGVDQKIREREFRNAAGRFAPSTIGVNDPEQIAADWLQAQETVLAFTDSIGAGPEAHVGAAFAGYYDTVPGEIVRVIE